ncbi:phospho-sugar mutase [Corynebacterium diphtheriae]|uniref:phospho-sugar mutase n=1 Tax=Corynebacterium diphtheriae TaxID=1717 RepID=UPI00024682C2|nr:phospho-sugar mutase [Corynebacterium diphtheriae]AEX75723.1 phosphomannomutase [Corynebacterium diphtheriae HC02]
MSYAELERTAREWADHDPDPRIKETIEGWLKTHDEESLQQAFNGPLTFGTAGLRARVGAGESQLSLAVILRTTYGLVNWVKTQLGADATPTIVIGCDARHGSLEFHQAAAEVVSAAGGRALLLPAKNPTPLTAFSVKKFGADAGIMVTASHNPPADNGYKVYLGGRIAQGPAEGVQLISPADKEISEAIAAAPYADEIPRTTDNIEHVDPREDYLTRALTLADKKSDILIALTAMHGVGAALGEKVLTAAGFNVSLVPEQAEPDPDFPTVSFPNPEEKGALDLAKAHANTIGADVIIAYDPDADRCAVATPDANAEGGWRQLSGDETGAVLGAYRAGVAKPGSMANSIVSGRLLSKIAEAAGRTHATTLTGFKWIARTPELVFGYEEAIGFCCDPEAVADKDGVSASVVVASLVSALKAEGRTLDDALDDLAREHGLYQTAPLTFRVDDLSIIARAMSTLRAQPPTELAGATVTEVTDLNDPTLPWGATDGMMFITDHNDRIICRPSGTEPKLKCYLEVVMPVTGDTIPRAEATQRLDAIATALRTHLGM